MPDKMYATRTHPVELSDGRSVIVREYPDHSVRVQLRGMGGKRYAVTECFLPGNGGNAIIKLELLD